MLFVRRFPIVVLQSVFLVSAVSIAGLTSAQDWPGWRGADRSDRSTETGLLQEWPKGGPAKKWTFDQAGIGYAGFAIVQGRLFTLGQDDEKEFALCLDAETGKEIWRTPVSEKYSNSYGDGPRGTPTIEGEFVYSLFADGTLACLKKEKGEIVWTRKMQEFGGKIPIWGYSESPLLDYGMVVCTPGGSEGSIIALDKTSGELKWQTSELDSDAHYSSLIAMDVKGKKQYVQLLVNRAVGIQSNNGKVLWQNEWYGGFAVIPTPVDVDGNVYVSSGYSAGSRLINAGAEGGGEAIWDNREVKNHHGGIILVDGYLYGHADRAGFFCQDTGDGSLKWKSGDIGKGCVTWADGRFYYVEEKTGDILLIEANPEKVTLRGKFTMEPQTQQRRAQGAVWVHPVVSGGKLFVRDQEFIHCYDIAN